MWTQILLARWTWPLKRTSCSRGVLWGCYLESILKKMRLVGATLSLDWSLLYTYCPSYFLVKSKVVHTQVILITLLWTWKDHVILVCAKIVFDDCRATLSFFFQTWLCILHQWPERTSRGFVVVCSLWKFAWPKLALNSWMK